MSDIFDLNLSCVVNMRMKNFFYFLAGRFCNVYHLCIDLWLSMMCTWNCESTREEIEQLTKILEICKMDGKVGMIPCQNKVAE